jgi:1-deoxy-D-xylulose-5-phosphate synthase
VGLALEAAALLRTHGVGCSVINARFCKPLDEEAILDAAQNFDRLATVEVNALAGGFGSAMLELLASKGMAVRLDRFGIPDEFVEHGAVSIQRSESGISPEAIAQKLLAACPKPPLIAA